MKQLYIPHLLQRLRRLIRRLEKTLREHGPGRGFDPHVLLGASGDNDSKVAITIVYRYQPRARAPIDAGELVADNGKIGDYRY